MPGAGSNYARLLASGAATPNNTGLSHTDLGGGLPEDLAFTLRWDISDVFKTVQLAAPGRTFNLRSLGGFGRWTSECGNFSGKGGAFHSIIVMRLEW